MFMFRLTKKIVIKFHKTSLGFETLRGANSTWYDLGHLTIKISK